MIIFVHLNIKRKLNDELTTVMVKSPEIIAGSSLPVCFRLLSYY